MHRNFTFIYLPPLFWVSCALIAGILLPPQIYWFVFAYFFIAALYVCNLFWSLNDQLFSKRLGLLSLACAAFLIGGYVYDWKITSYRVMRTSITNQRLDITGTIVDKQERIGKCAVLLTVKLENIRTRHGEISTHYYAKLFLRKPSDHKIGDRITYNNIYCSPTKDENELRSAVRDSSLLTAFVNHQDYVALNKSKSISVVLSCWISTHRHVLAKRIKRKMTSEHFSLFSSLFLGTSLDNSQEQLKNSFNQWGITHYLARSGLHVVIMLMAWQTLLRLIPLHMVLKNLLLLLILFIYSALSWSSVSFLRAVVSYTFARCLAMQGFQLHGIHIISITAITVLIFNPLHLFFLNFQLSFGLALALAWLNEIDKKTAVEHKKNLHLQGSM